MNLDGKEFWEMIDKRIEQKVQKLTPKRVGATVLSVGAGKVTVQLATDPLGEPVVVSNPNEKVVCM